MEENSVESLIVPVGRFSFSAVPEEWQNYQHWDNHVEPGKDLDFSYCHYFQWFVLPSLSPFLSPSFLIFPVFVFLFLLLPNLHPTFYPWNIFLWPCLTDRGHHRSISIWAPLSLHWTACHNQKKQLQSPTQSCYFWIAVQGWLQPLCFSWNKPPFPCVNMPL